MNGDRLCCLRFQCVGVVEDNPLRVFSKFICKTVLFTLNQTISMRFRFVLGNTVFVGIEHVSVVNAHVVSLMLQQRALFRNGRQFNTHSEIR